MKSGSKKTRKVETVITSPSQTDASTQKRPQKNATDGLDDGLNANSESEFGGFDEDSEEVMDFEDTGSESDDYGDLEMEENPLEKLRKLKEMKKKGADPMEELRKVKEKKREKAKKTREKPENDEDPLEQLRKLKEKKKEQTEAVKEPKKSKKSEKYKNTEKSAIAPIDSHTASQLRKDDDDIAYWSKKLGLKGKKKLTAQDENDLVGGLLDGLDFMDDYAETGMDDGDMSARSDGDSEAENSEGGFDSEDGFHDSEMESSLSDSDSQSGLDSDLDSSSENPYIAPTKYVPPAVRRQQESESSEVVALKRATKGPLNRLSESNISSIVNEIVAQFSSNPRQIVNETITAIVLESIVLQGRLLDTFVHLHAATVAALYRLRGIDFGAYFLQTLVEKFDASSDPKERSNLITLLSSVYAYGLVSSKLVYDFIKLFISDLGEENADILLRLIRTSGNQLRSEDPTALKEIVLLTNKAAAEVPRASKSTRLQFLVETIGSLKNNKLKIVSEPTFQLVTRLKKYLSSIKSSRLNDPIQVSLADIRNVSTQGKWWLVGSAWKGDESEKNQASAFPGSEESPEHQREQLDLDMELSEPNWIELARAQRMNTDVRRAIFVSIMSANDYIDAVTKIDKLGLKRAQQKEVPRILLHCAGIEPAWNPYYGLLASKLCEGHIHRKLFQFMLWDLLKELDGTQDDFSDPEDHIGFNDDESTLKRTLNLGRLFGFLFAQESIPLHLLKNINFLTASGDLAVFLELTFVTFFDRVAKRAKHGKRLNETVHVELLAKLQNEPTLMKGMRLFIQKLQASEYATSDKQRSRVQWGIESATTILDEMISRSDDQ